jgi:integrase
MVGDPYGCFDAPRASAVQHTGRRRSLRADGSGGTRLRRCRHDVAVAAPTSFAAHVAAAGLPHLPFPDVPGRRRGSPSRLSLPRVESLSDQGRRQGECAGTLDRVGAPGLQPGRRYRGRYRVLILAAAFTGLRRGELLDLRRMDVDLAARTIEVRRSIAQLTGGRQVVGPPSPGRPRQHACHRERLPQGSAARSDPRRSGYGRAFRRPNGQDLVSKLVSMAPNVQISVRNTTAVILS